jgi:hypothetical protein
MAKTFEVALTIVKWNKRKWLIRLNQNGAGGGNSVLPYALVTHMPPGQKQPPNPMYFCKRNVETPYRSLRGQLAAKSAYGGAGIGYRKKRMPRCNGADTGFNVTRRESGPTSDWWCVARKFGEPLLWGNANGRCIMGVCATSMVHLTCTSAAGEYRAGNSGSNPSSRVNSCLLLAFVLLEPSDGKLSCSVPRGLDAGDRVRLPS